MGPPAGLDRPPPVTITAGDRSFDLDAWTYCYGNVCADGAPPEDLVDVGTVDQVRVSFPEPGWSFEATFTEAGRRCGAREFSTALTRTDGGTYLLEPAGYAGTYDVTLFGVGVGDLFVTFRWATPMDGVVEPPEARLAVLANHDGAVDSYGVELALANLARTPDDVSATVTVRSATGDEVTFDATRARGGCFPEGTVYWDGPDAPGRAAAELGDGPFTYEVTVTLDGVRYDATATWPDDEIVGNEPSVALDFEPDLPAA